MHDILRDTFRAGRSQTTQRMGACALRRATLSMSSSCSTSWPTVDSGSASRWTYVVAVDVAKRRPAQVAIDVVQPDGSRAGLIHEDGWVLPLVDWYAQDASLRSRSPIGRRAQSFEMSTSRMAPIEDALFQHFRHASRGSRGEAICSCDRWASSEFPDTFDNT